MANNFTRVRMIDWLTQCMMHDACVWNDVWLAAHKILLEQNERPDKAMDESEREGD